MGMSSSQARLLSITARMNDVEFKSQSIANTKIRLADESEQVSREYTAALGKSKLMHTSYATGQAVTIALTPQNLAQFGYRLKSASGIESAEIQNASEYDLYEMIESGEFYLEKAGVNTGLTAFEDGLTYYTLVNGAYQAVSDPTPDANTVYYSFDNNGGSMTSIAGNNQLAIGSVDSATLAKAEADYNAATARINRKEKLLDNEMKALDTEHNALKTEQDSIKSLIKDNVDKTFNIFG